VLLGEVGYREQSGGREREFRKNGGGGGGGARGVLGGRVEGEVV